MNWSNRTGIQAIFENITSFWTREASIPKQNVPIALNKLIFSYTRDPSVIFDIVPYDYAHIL